MSRLRIERKGFIGREYWPENIRRLNLGNLIRLLVLFQKRQRTGYLLKEWMISQKLTLSRPFFIFTFTYAPTPHTFTNAGNQYDIIITYYTLSNIIITHYKFL